MLKENKRYFPTRYALFLVLITVGILFYSLFILLLAKKYFIVKPLLYLLKIFVSLSVISSRLCSEAKCSWVFFILALPFISIPIYFVFCRTRLTKKEKILLGHISENKPKSDVFGGKMTLKCNEDFTFLSEIADFSSAAVYDNTTAKYIGEVDRMLKLLSFDISRAKRFIFLEFYTVAAGEVFGELLDRLIEKAREGVEIRIIYDELGSLSRIPEHFPAIMENYGIRAVPHASLMGSFPSALNNRNHRKIAVIDGEVAYTGGINLADEYLYPKRRLGKWKDSAVRIEGEGVSALTYTFLSDFTNATGEPEDFSVYYKYRKQASCGKALIFDDGPLPHYKEKCSERIIVSMLNSAEKYFTITTPYLVCGKDIFAAIRGAVRRGVRVKIIIPSKPDKPLPWLLTRSTAASLSEIGAEVYKYSPGFLHSKTYCADGKYLMCGSVNLDYRSLCHNYENGILFALHPIIGELEADTEKILAESERYKKKRESLPVRIFGAVMELFAPLF